MDTQRFATHLGFSVRLSRWRVNSVSLDRVPGPEILLGNVAPHLVRIGGFDQPIGPKGKCGQVNAQCPLLELVLAMR